jgi:serine/threonine protein kinase
MSNPAPTVLWADVKIMTTLLQDVYRLADFVDTFALGHYARVLSATDRRTGKAVAFKVLRTEHLSPDGDMRWEYRAFPSEADLLSRLAASPSIVKLLDCGYLESTEEAPTDGQLVSFGTQVKAFAQAAPEHAEKGWRPYLALEDLPRANNLLYLMKPNQPGTRWRLPTEEGIALAMQFAQFLQLAHAQRVVYLDHKLEHVYWDGARLQIIDLNSSRLLAGQADDANQFRADLRSLCVGILYPAFTGISAINGALRAQPSSMSEVEARYQSVADLDFGVEPSLSPALQDLLQRGARQQFATVGEFMSALQQVAALHGWDAPETDNTPARRQARDQMRAALRKLRQGQDALRDARDLLRDAAIMDDISPDLEAELRRLVKAANQMLGNRVIP